MQNSQQPEQPESVYLGSPVPSEDLPPATVPRSEFTGEQLRAAYEVCTASVRTAKRDQGPVIPKSPADANHHYALLAALLEERRVRILGQSPDVHWESMRHIRRACYAATDAAIAKATGGAL